MANASFRLKPNILKGIIAMGYDKSNEVQDTLLEILFADPPPNIIVNSQLDQNNLVPFIIVMLQRIDPSQNYPQALCISSTNQMAKQIIEIGSKIAQFSSIKFGYINDDVTNVRNSDEHIIVVAPQLLYKLISDELCDFNNIKIFMLIDTDEMFTDECQHHCKKIGMSKLPETCQRLFLSTSVAQYARPIAKRGVFFDFLQKPGSMDEIVQFYVRCRDKDEKFQIIRNNNHLLCNKAFFPSIIYSQKHETASWLAGKITNFTFYSKEISVEDQIKGLKMSQSTKTITTDALFPYLHFEHLPFVVNFDIPVNENGEADFDTYFNRISRMGRFGTGIVINLVDSEQQMEACCAIEKHFGKTIYPINDEDLHDFEIINIDSKSADDIVVSFFQKIFCREDPHMSLLSTRTYEELNLRPDFCEKPVRPSKFMETVATAFCANPERNVIAQGQAGTGKTTTMYLVLMNRINTKKKYPQVLCVVPNIDLVEQITMGINQAQTDKGFYGRVWCFSAKDYSIRGVFNYQNPKQVIIGTPKHIIDMMNWNAFDTEKISLLAVDDAECIISTQNLWNDLKSIFAKLSPKCQTMLFSTAYSPTTMVNALNFVKDPIVISLPRTSELPQNITQYYATYRNQEEKYQATLKLFKIICIFNSIIFCNTKEKAMWLEKRLKKDHQPYGKVIEVISDDTSDAELLKIMFAWNVLITSTSVHDMFFIKNVIVVNFDMPIDPFGEVEYENYLQRISRTARFGTNGVAVNMIDENDDHEVVACRAIEQHFGKKVHYINF